MITAIIKPWVPINGLEQTSVSWVVGTSVDENGLVTDIIDQALNSDMLTMFYSDVEVPIGVTYYVQAKRHFNDSSADYWGKPLAVSSGEIDFNNIILNGDIFIEQPYVIVNGDDFKSENSKVTIKTTRFRSNLDTHFATHWIIKDGSGKVLYINLLDKVNKTSIEIDNDYIYRSKSKLKVIAIHVGASRVESKVGYKDIVLNDKVNYEITTKLLNVDPLEDLIVKFKPVTDYDLRIVRVDLVDGVTGSDVLSNLTITDDKLTVPWYLLQEGSKYKLKITSYDVTNATDDSTMVVYQPLTVLRLENTSITNPEYKYSNTLVTYTDDRLFNTVPTAAFHCEAMLNGTILMPADDGSVDIWVFKDNFFSKTTSKANGLTLASDSLNNLLLKPLTKSLILVDGLNTDGKPTFQLFKYDINSDKFSLINSKTRTDETACLGWSNSIIQVSSELLLYSVWGSNLLRTYNVVTNEVNDINYIPLEGVTKAILLRLRNSRIFVANGTDYHAAIYDIERNRFIEGYQFVPAEFINENLRAIQLINGSSLIVKLNAASDTTDTSSGYLSTMEVFDYNSGDFKEFDNSNKLSMYKVSASILTRTGEVLFVKNNTDKTSVWIYK